jgi:enoyl-CoA hydratase/carnithine racemase
MFQTSQAIIVEKTESTVTIRFNRPEIRSPLSVAVLVELNCILDSIKDETVIFTGVDNVFASGADLREIAEVTGKTAKEYAERGQNLMTKIETKNAIAFVNGFCFGGALDLALSCKKRIAAPNALFCHPGANLGIMTGWGGTQRLPRLIGEAFALEMFLTAKKVDANEALRIGLIDEIHESNKLSEFIPFIFDPPI